MAFYVYLIEQVGTPHVKIGVSDDPVRRLNELHRMNPGRLAVRYVFQMKDRASAYQLETRLHNQFAHVQHRAEWFNVKSVRVVEHVLRNPHVFAGTERIIEYPDWVIEYRTRECRNLGLTGWVDAHPGLMYAFFALVVMYSQVALSSLGTMAMYEVIGYWVLTLAGLGGALSALMAHK